MLLTSPQLLFSTPGQTTKMSDCSELYAFFEAKDHHHGLGPGNVAGAPLGIDARTLA